MDLLSFGSHAADNDQRDIKSVFESEFRKKITAVQKMTITIGAHQIKKGPVN